MSQVLKLRHTSKTGKSAKSEPNTPPRRVPNASVRSREYLTPAEVSSMIDAARSAGRYGHRDAALILLAYRHALRVSELVSLQRDQVDLEQGTLHVNRMKNGTPSVHPLRGLELRALRRLYREYTYSPYVFSTERKGPMTASPFSRTATCNDFATTNQVDRSIHLRRHFFVFCGTGASNGARVHKSL